MATLKLTLDTRLSSRDKDGNFPLVLRIGHKSKTRDIPFKIHLSEADFNENPKKIKALRNEKRLRVQNVFSSVDLWLDDNKADIKLWDIAKLKDEVERRFFKKQSELNILQHAAKLFFRLASGGQHSTASSYEDGLKTLVKFRMKLARQNDKVAIKSLFDKEAKGGYTVKEQYLGYDMPIKAVNPEFAKDLRAYMSGRGYSINTVRIHLRSLQSILSDAEKSYNELKGHKPFEGIKKTSVANKPVILTKDEINQIRSLKNEFNGANSKFHVINYFLFMFNNMGMNFIDIAYAKVGQFDGERFRYTRKKTEEEGDDFSIKQNDENLEIIDFYIHGKDKDNYLFPIIPKGTRPERVFRIKKDKTLWFNKHMKQIGEQLGIEKKITSYTPRDTWTNIGLQLGIDLRKISAGLGHSTISVTEKHYAASIQEKIFDEINAQITNSI